MAKPKSLPPLFGEKFDLNVEIIDVDPSRILGAPWANYARVTPPRNEAGEEIQQSTLNELVEEVNSPLLIRPIHEQEVATWKSKTGNRDDVEEPEYTIIDGFGRFRDHLAKHGPTCEVPCKLIEITGEFEYVKQRSVLLSHNMNATSSGASWLDHIQVLEIAGGMDADLVALAATSSLTKRSWEQYRRIYKKFGPLAEIHRRVAEGANYSKLLKAATGKSSEGTAEGKGATKVTGGQIAKFGAFALQRAKEEEPTDKKLHAVIATTNAALNWLAGDQKEDFFDAMREAGLHDNESFAFDFVVDGKEMLAEQRESEKEEEKEAEAEAPKAPAKKAASKKAKAPTKKAASKKAKAPAKKAASKKATKKAKAPSAQALLAKK